MNNDKALEILDHNWTRLVNSDYTDEELGQAQDMAIEALEERPTGEWIYVQIGNTKYIECSNCKEQFYSENSLEVWSSEYKYCHRCGAKMSGEQ